jgi:hypothetical protein
MRTDKQIVMETNELARYLLGELVGTGYQAPDGFTFWNAEDPRAQKAWLSACHVMEMTTKTEVEQALANYLEEAPRKYQSPTGSPINRVLETVPVVAFIDSVSADGHTVYYAGNTEVLWDEQKPVRRENSFVFLDEDGQEWDFIQLSPLEEAA